jgi:O-antigen/teichoic acid export membrane protein
VNPPTRNTDDRLSRALIEQRFRVNSKLIILARIATAGLSLATIPVLVSRLGVAGYGTWEALLALATLSSLFQLAINGTLVWRVSAAYGTGDSAEIRRLARLGAGACLLLFASIWPIAWFFREPIVGLLLIPADTREPAVAMFPIVVGLLLLGGLSATLESIVSGCQRTGVVNVVGAAAQILNYTVVIIVAVLGGGLWSLAAGQAAAFVGRFAGAWAATRAAFGSISLIPILPTRSDISLLRYSGLLMVGSVAAALRDQTDKVILASLASPAWVAYYGIAARLAGLVMEIIGFVYFPILTAAGALNAIGDWDGVRTMYRRLMAVVSIVCGLVVVVVAGLADRIIILWLGYPIPEATLLLWLLFTGSASAVMLTGPGPSICLCAGRPGIETAYLTFNLVLNLILTITLVLVIGPIGTAVATGTTWATSSVVFLFVLHKRLDLPADASRNAAAAALLAALLAVVVYNSSRLFGLPDGRLEAFVSLLVWAVGSASAYFGLAVALGLTSVDQAYGGLRALLRRAG